MKTGNIAAMHEGTPAASTRCDVTLADAAVKLRRLDALLDGEDPARQLLISALAVVETAVDVNGMHVDRARG